MSDSSDLLHFIDASPSPFHVVQTTINRLISAGFVERTETEDWESPAGKWFVQRGGAIVAWVHRGQSPETPFRLIGAHTDSPNLRIKPRAESTSAGFNRLNVEVYGGVLLNSWLDRDLGLSGRVSVRGPAGIETRLFRDNRPLLRIPQLAIHLDREISTNGLKLNKQTHMVPVWGTTQTGTFRRYLSELIDTEEADVVAWDAMLHDLTPGEIVGLDESLVASARLDNQLSCWAAVEALLAADAEPTVGPIPLIAMFDHEEVGSVSQTGAASSMLPTLIERIVRASGGHRDDLHRSLAASWCVSADGAHATHPNYPDRHEPNHHILVNGGPVVKINANERYATSSPSHAFFVDACERANVPYQQFVSRTDLACGSTIGPVTSARLGIRTVDAGVAQLSMHSARETAGAFDPPRFVKALTAVLT